MVDPKPRGPATELALRHLRTLKPEHQTLLGTLLADEGMASATLETLVEHLFEEEDPRLGLALARVKAGASVASVAGAALRPGASVGSLRVERGSASASVSPHGTVGSLRR